MNNTWVLHVLACSTAVYLSLAPNQLASCSYRKQESSKSLSCELNHEEKVSAFFILKANEVDRIEIGRHS